MLHQPAWEGFTKVVSSDFNQELEKEVMPDK
jgi:hypothetical protein